MPSFGATARPWIFAAFSLLVTAASCSPLLEGSLEIVTTANEVLTEGHGAVLNPLGDALDVPRDAVRGVFRVDGGAPKALEAGSRVEVMVDETDRAPGVVSRLLVDGEERLRREGRMRVRVEWVTVVRRRLPPKTRTLEFLMKRGETTQVDTTVMYTPLPGSVLEDVATTVRITGPDGDRLRWRSDGEPVEGRVQGAVVAGGD